MDPGGVLVHLDQANDATMPRPSEESATLICSGRDYPEVGMQRANHLNAR